MASAHKIPDELITDEGTPNDPNTIVEKLNCLFACISDKLKAQQTQKRIIMHILIGILSSSMYGKSSRTRSHSGPINDIR